MGQARRAEDNNPSSKQSLDFPVPLLRLPSSYSFTIYNQEKETELPGSHRQYILIKPVVEDTAVCPWKSVSTFIGQHNAQPLQFEEHLQVEVSRRITVSRTHPWFFSSVF